MEDLKLIASPEDKPRELPITQDDKERYLKTILSDAPYTETIDVLDGKTKITFQALTVQQNEDVIAQVQEDQKNGVAENTDSYYITISGYRLGLSLAAVDGKPFQTAIERGTYKSDGKKSYVAARADVFKSWSAFKLSLYFDLQNQFENKIVRLNKEVQTQDFWKASK